MKWSKRLESLTEKGEFSPQALPVSGCSPHKEAGCLLALAGQYKPLTGLPFWGLPSVIMRHLETADLGSSFASRRECHSFTQAHHRVSKVQQKTCFLGKKELALQVSFPCPEEPRTSPQDERLLLTHEGCQDSWPLEKRNSIQGQWQGLSLRVSV